MLVVEFVLASPQPEPNEPYDARLVPVPTGGLVEDPIRGRYGGAGAVGESEVCIRARGPEAALLIAGN